MRTYKKEREEISGKWFNSELKGSRPNLVLKAEIQAGKLSFIVGTYKFNSLTGISSVTPIMEKMNYTEAKEIIK